MNFKKGYREVKYKDVKDVKRKIMKIFGVSTPSSWYNHLNGKTEPTIKEYKAVDELFKGYGITDIWED